MRIWVRYEDVELWAKCDGEYVRKEFLAKSDWEILYINIWDKRKGLIVSLFQILYEIWVKEFNNWDVEFGEMVWVCF